MPGRKNDEYYSPQNVVDMIVPYIVKSGYKNIWCPFDKQESRFVQTFTDLGFNVSYGHIETGQDFFDYTEPQGDIVVSNPPFSKKNEILDLLYKMNVPFALVMNFNGLFDNEVRRELFKKNRFELLIPCGRMRFSYNYNLPLCRPNFQCIYLCSGLLDEQITFSDATFKGVTK